MFIILQYILTILNGISFACKSPRGTFAVCVIDMYYHLVLSPIIISVITYYHLRKLQEGEIGREISTLVA